MAMGEINGADLAIMLGKWGPAPQPWAIVLERCPDPNVVTDEKLREAITATGLPWRVQDIGTGIELLLVPPGTFTMVCSPSLLYNCDPGEYPIQQVAIEHAFYLGRYEVTQAQWMSVMASNPSTHQGQPNSDIHPVDGVSWNMAQAFAAATGLRLPTEPEWEFACRAGTTTAFNNGSDDDATVGTLAWYSETSAGHTWPLGQKAANAFGFHDMHGNVWEWPESRPFVIGGTVFRIIRGGAWDTTTKQCRSSHRSLGHGDTGLSNRGLRVARTP